MSISAHKRRVFHARPKPMHHRMPPIASAQGIRDQQRRGSDPHSTHYCLSPNHTILFQEILCYLIFNQTIHSNCQQLWCKSSVTRASSFLKRDQLYCRGTESFTNVLWNLDHAGSAVKVRHTPPEMRVRGELHSVPARDTAPCDNTRDSHDLPRRCEIPSQQGRCCCDARYNTASGPSYILEITSLHIPKHICHRFLVNISMWLFASIFYQT